MWEVEFTDEFEQWWHELDEEEQVSLAASVTLLEQLGPGLPVSLVGVPAVDLDPTPAVTGWTCAAVDSSSDGSCATRPSPMVSRA